MVFVEVFFSSFCFGFTLMGVYMSMGLGKITFDISPYRTVIAEKVDTEYRKSVELEEIFSWKSVYLRCQIF